MIGRGMDEKLAYYLRQWDCSQPQPLTETVTSQLYTVTYRGAPAVLKLLTEYGWEEQRGGAALRCFDGHGAVQVYQMDAGAQLLEYAGGDELITLVERGGDAEATRIIAGVLARLHSADPANCDGVFPLDEWFRDLFGKAEADERAGIESIYRRGAQLARRLLDDPRDVRVLHGDIHHRNIRHSARGWLAFDAKGLIGERTYDCANTLCNPFRGVESFDPLVHDERRLLANAAILADALEIDRARVLAFTFAYACLSASWSLNDDRPGAVQWSLNIAALVEPHLS